MSKVEFKQANTKRFSTGRNQKIEYVVIHYTANNGDTAAGNVNYFSSNADTASSAHYFVDEGNTVWQSVKDNDTAWHCGAKVYKHKHCRNSNSIGIEMCSRKDSKGVYYIKPETVANAVRLTQELMKKYSIPLNNVLRHYDVTGKACPEPFVRDEKQWDDFKKHWIEETSSASAGKGAESDAYEKSLSEMVSIGVIISPDYWNTVKASRVRELFCNALKGNRLDKRISNGISDIDIALNVLLDAGIISSQDALKEEIESIKFTKELLINIANKSKIVLQKIVHAEAAGEGEMGQLLVANIILNRQKDSSFPNGIYDIVFQCTEKNGEKIYQFSPIKDGAYKRAVPSESVVQAVDKALNGIDESKGATYFCTEASSKKADSWHERALEFTFQHGAHRFYKVKSKK